MCMRQALEWDGSCLLLNGFLWRKYAICRCREVVFQCRWSIDALIAFARDVNSLASVLIKLAAASFFLWGWFFSRLPAFFIPVSTGVYFIVRTPHRRIKGQRSRFYKIVETDKKYETLLNALEPTVSQTLQSELTTLSIR